MRCYLEPIIFHIPSKLWICASNLNHISTHYTFFNILPQIMVIFGLFHPMKFHENIGKKCPVYRRCPAETTPFARRLDQFLKTSEMDKTMEKPLKEGTEHRTQSGGMGYLGDNEHGMTTCIYVSFLYLYGLIKTYGFVLDWIHMGR